MGACHSNKETMSPTQIDNETSKRLQMVDLSIVEESNAEPKLIERKESRKNNLSRRTR